MAQTKKTAAAKATDTMTEEAKTTPAAPVAETVAETKEEVKAETVRKAGRKPAARKTTAKKASTKRTAAAKKTTAKEETVTKEAPAKRTAKEAIHLQFADKDYTSEDLVKIAKDVWKYDLKQKLGDFKTVELYVKPDESMVYYVINGDVTGSFAI